MSGAPEGGNGAPRRSICVGAAATAGLVAALLVAVGLNLLLARISVDQPLESRELIDWGWRWGGALAVALATGAGLGGRPPAGPRSAALVAATIAALTVLLCLVAMGLAVAAVRLGVWGQGWGLPSRSTYAAQIAALLAAQWSGLPGAALGAWLLWRGRLRATLPPLRALPRCRPNLDRLTRLLTLVIAVAVMLNGLPFWARRIGLLERQAYRQDLARFCTSPVQPWWLPASCRPHRFDTASSERRVWRLDPARLYQISPLEVGLKGLRYGVIVLLMIASAVLLIARWSPPPQTLLPLLPLLVSTVLSAAISLPLDGAAFTLLSGIGSLWIPLAALAAWLTTPRRLQILADGAASLVLLQVPFLLLEAMRGLPLPFGGTASPWLPTRLSGMVNQPNTLGGLLAVSVAFCLCLSQRRWQRWPLLALSLLIAILARSGGGVAGLSLLAAGLVLKNRRPRPGQLLALLLAFVLLTAALPRLLGRPQLLESPAGRLRTMRMWLHRPHTPQEWLLGYGLASQISESPMISTAVGQAPPAPQRDADGMPPLLLSQGGLLALVAFYGLLAWCFVQDPPLRLFWFVLVVTSLSLRVTEVFPFGIWMAVAAARSLGLPRQPGSPLISWPLRFPLGTFGARFRPAAPRD
jgi:hypothetical protein